MDHTVTYRYDRNDYIALLRAQRSLGLLGRLGRWGRYACFALFFVVLINLLDFSSGSFDLPDLITSGLVFVAIFLAAPLGEFIGERVLARWIFPRFSAANKDITLTFGDDGIHSKYGGMEGRLPWQSLVRILETENYLFLSISRAETIVVPRRALPSPAAAEELAHYIRSKVDAAAAAA
jgi:hypothetical protein